MTGHLQNTTYNAQNLTNAEFNVRERIVKYINIQCTREE